MSEETGVDRVLSGSSPVAVYGMGYVGLALTAVYLRHGLRVIGVDINRDKLDSIRRGELGSTESEIREAVIQGLRNERLILTNDGVRASNECRVKVVTVPVYMDWISKKVRFNELVSALKAIAEGIQRGDLIIIESSVPVGTTEEVAKPVLESVSGLRVENDFYLAYSPERIYVGRAVKDIEERYPKIVSGVGSKSLREVSRFYEHICLKGVIRLSSTKAAEFEKLAEGIYRDVNIALANELALLAQSLGIDYYEVREAANSQPYCHLHLPGPGVGGYCIPLYPYYMMLNSLKHGIVLETVRTARRINESMPNNVVRLVNTLSLELGIRPERTKVAVLGASFRGDIDDTRLSPTHDIVAGLKSMGFHEIVVHDPLVKADPELGRLGVRLTDDLREALNKSKIIVICVRHTAYSKLKVSEILRMSGNDAVVVDTVNIVIDDGNYCGKGRLVVLGKGTCSDIRLTHF